MRTKFYLDNPDDMQATMEITMSVKEWKELKEELSDKYPSWQLSSSIMSLICQAEKVFNEKTEE